MAALLQRAHKLAFVSFDVSPDMMMTLADSLDGNFGQANVRS